MKVFIVDDNAEIRGLVRSVVSDLADEIFEFQNAFNITTQYEQHQPN